MKLIRILVPAGLVLAGALLLFAYRGTRGKVDILFRIHINEELVRESAFGEVPTFSIWLEDPSTGACQTVFVTRRMGEGDWEGKAEVPTALPFWSEVFRKENETKAEDPGAVQASIAVTGATPEPGYFTTRTRVKTGSDWICWIEMNLSGDYNSHYRAYDQVEMKEDVYGTGQPALVYRALIRASEGIEISPGIEGMSVNNPADGPLVRPLEGITTAAEVFDEISISVVRPNPKIIN